MNSRSWGFSFTIVRDLPDSFPSVIFYAKRRAETGRWGTYTPLSASICGISGLWAIRFFGGGGLGQGFRYGNSLLADRRERAFGEPLRHVKTNDQTGFRHGPGKSD